MSYIGHGIGNDEQVTGKEVSRGRLEVSSEYGTHTPLVRTVLVCVLHIKYTCMVI